MFLTCAVVYAAGQTSTFTYQGKLTDNSATASGAYHMQFSLWDAASGGNQVGPTLTFDGAGSNPPAVQVTSGIFTVALDFNLPTPCSACFDGNTRWLKVAVKRPADSAYTDLSRQQVTSAPYAVKSLKSDTATNSLQLGGAVASQYVLTTDTRMTDARNPLANSTNYIQNTTTQQSSSAFNISGDGTVGGTLTGNTVNANAQFNISGNRILSAPGGNLFAGFDAGRANNSGTNNAFFGTQAGEENSTGSSNSFFGRRAGNGNLSGSNNTLVGAATSLALPDLTFATAIGAGAQATSSNTLTLGRGSDTVLVPGNVNVAGTIAGVLKWQTVSGTSQQAQPNNGYLTNNDSQVTVTLPTAPNIGDIVRVSGIGAGGWKIAQNAGQTVLGANLGLSGSNWTPREANRLWQSVSCSANGNKLVVAVWQGLIYTSSDSGMTWTARENTRNWISVASSADGNKLVAAVKNGQIYTSTDSGVTWTPRDINRSWWAVASSADGSRLVAVLNPGLIYTSSDSGISWNPRESSRYWQAVASSADGYKLVALENDGINGGGQIYTSADSGVTWTPRESVRHWWAVASSADGNKLVAVVKGGQIYTSSDSGVTWTPHESNRVWWAVASSSDGNKLIAAVNAGQLYHSTDSGLSWTPRESNRQWWALASSADGNKLFSLDYQGQIYVSEPNTTPGTAGFLQGLQGSAVELQYIGNGQFLPISHEGTIYGY